MRRDWLSGWSGVTGVRSIGRGGRDKLSIQKRGCVGMVDGADPCGCGWSGDVIETWRGGWYWRGPRC